MHPASGHKNKDTQTYRHIHKDIKIPPVCAEKKAFPLRPSLCHCQFAALFISLFLFASSTQIGKRKTGTINPANIWQILRCSSRTPKNAMGGLYVCVGECVSIVDNCCSALCWKSKCKSKVRPLSANSNNNSSSTGTSAFSLSLAVYRSLIRLSALPLLFGSPRLFGFASFVGARSHSCALFGFSLSHVVDQQRQWGTLWVFVHVAVSMCVCW